MNAEALERWLKRETSRYLTGGMSGREEGGGNDGREGKGCVESRKQQGEEEKRKRLSFLLL